MQVLFRGKADFMREIADALRQADIAACSGPLPGG